jgi:uncharacterized protein YyaL (SSP411 family)
MGAGDVEQRPVAPPARWSAPLGGWHPWRVLAWGEADGVPLLADRPPVGGRATAYVCHGFVCDAPTTDVEELRAALGEGPARNR